LATARKLVSFGRRAFPAVTARTRAFRAVVRLSAAQVFIDLVLMGKGSTAGLTLMVAAPTAAAASFRTAEVRLARMVASRVK
jgi:hypothetical protein